MKTWQLVLIGVALLAFTWFWDALFVGDIVKFIIFALLALVLIIVTVLDKKDDKDSEKAENITVKNMLGRLFAKRAQNPKIIGTAANGKNLTQGCCPRCGIILDSSYKRCPKCWQKLRW